MADKLIVTSPYDQSEIKSIPLEGESAAEEKLSRAYALYKSDTEIPKHRRIKILEKAALLMEEKKDELVKIAASEGGKPLVDSKVEVDRAINGVKLGIHAIAELSGKEIPMGSTPSSEGRIAFTQREPIGVVVSLSAFNHPLNLIVHQTIPAIAAGCPVIVKPASATPLSCLAFVDILHEAGLPSEWCQAIVCPSSVAEKLATDERVNYLSFIGSAKIGWSLRSKVAAGTRCGLEHGGVAPVIIDENYDLDQLVAPLSKGGFYHAGQVCVSVQRIFVCGGNAKKLANKLAEKAKQLKVGDPLDSSTEVGPLIQPKEVERVASWVKESKGEILCGGEQVSETCYAPTVILNPSLEAKVSKEEIFGPVICVYDCKSIDEAIKLSNSTPFAFQASVFTNDLNNAFNISKRLNATAVMINDHTAFRVDWMPFGGREASGLGLGGIGYSVHEMTRDKLRVFNLG